jgi:cytoskeletal protein CcmA (bactofilin family)
MSFFKEFKDDLSQAVNELLPNDEVNQEDEQDQIVNTLDKDETVADDDAENEKMKEWLEEFVQKDEKDTKSDDELMGDDLLTKNEQENDTDELDETVIDQNDEEEVEKMDDNVDLELLSALSADEETENIEDNREKTMPKLRAASVETDDDVTIITKGTTITGNISSDGSLDIKGIITGDVECLGKLSITGKIVGNSSAAEVYVNTERLEGSITSEGSVKVGLGTVIIGDIIATSGVIAGAIKGEIDINGPIVIDSTAIIKGNIKAKSVQINNGAVIEGFCSLSYAAVDVDNIFE